MDTNLDVSVLCRICLQTAEILSSIYASDESDIRIMDKIYQTTNIELKQYHNVPEKICDKCLLDLDSAYRFRMNCETSEVILEQYIEADNDDKGLDVKSEGDFCVEYLEETELKNDMESEELLIEQPITVVESKPKEQTIMVSGRKLTYIPLTKEELSAMKTIRKPGKAAAVPLVCEICGTNYKSKSEHANHLRRHLGEKNYACEECGNSFVDKSALVRHIRRHTGERPYKCKYCENRFSDYTTVKRHERTHTGERPYTCKICNKSFALQCVLLRHELAIHSGIKKYECEKCGKKFAQSHHLKQHDNVHLKEEGKPYKKYIRPKRKTEKKLIVQETVTNETETIKLDSEEDLTIIDDEAIGALMSDADLEIA